MKYYLAVSDTDVRLCYVVDSGNLSSMLLDGITYDVYAIQDADVDVAMKVAQGSEPVDSFVVGKTPDFSVVGTLIETGAVG